MDKYMENSRLDLPPERLPSDSIQVCYSPTGLARNAYSPSPVRGASEHEKAATLAKCDEDSISADIPARRLCCWSSFEYSDTSETDHSAQIEKKRQLAGMGYF